MWFARPPEEKGRELFGFVHQSHVSTESLASTPGAELPYVIVSHTFLKEKSKLLFLMPGIVLITSCSHALIRLYKGLGQSTLAEALDPALVPRASSAPVPVSSLISWVWALYQ